MTDPTLPQSEVDTTYSLPTGTTHNCSTSAEFATALSNAALNDVIVLTAGNTFTIVGGASFVLPNKGAGTQWIYIVSSALASLPAVGTRVAIADASDMPKVRTTTAGQPAVTTATAAHHFRFVGIEFTSDTAATLTDAIVDIGNDESSSANLPHHIILDRCYIHGNSTLGARRGVHLDGNNCAVTECYISDCKEAGADSQAVGWWNAEGPFLVHNSYLEGAGENVMLGGADSAITNNTPSDITITRNNFFKPLAWITEGWSVKNLFELKHAQRALINGNVFENYWTGAQSYAFAFTVRNQGGTNDWATVSDITVTNNKILNSESMINLLTQDSDNFDSDTMKRVLFRNNLFEMAGVNTGPYRFCLISHGDTLAGEDIQFIHNTLVAQDAGGATFYLNLGIVSASLDVKDNILGPMGSGVFKDADGSGDTALDASITTWVYENNLHIANAFGVPTGNFEEATVGGVGFVDFNGGDYRLDSGSDYAAGNAFDASDGLDLGADIDAIEAAIAGEGGGGGSATPAILMPQILL